MKEYEKNSPLDKIIEKTMTNLKTITDSNTVFGNPITTTLGTTIIPVSKISVGFVVGGGEYADLSSRRVANHFPLAGGSGGGVSLLPLGFIVDSKTEVKFISAINHKDEKVYDLISKMIKFLETKKKEDKNEN